MNKKKGFGLVTAIILAAILLVLGAAAAKIVYHRLNGAQLLLEREAAFWLAEGGWEQAKIELTHNLNWYSDLPHYPEDDGEWLKRDAIGCKMAIGEGEVKIIREKDKQRVYTVGKSKRGVVVIRYDYAVFPLKLVQWQELW